MSNAPNAADPVASTGRGTTPRRDWRALVMAQVALLAVWLALWGRVTVPLVVGGLVAGALILVLFPLPPVGHRLRLHPWRAAVLVVRFAWDVVVASLQVSYLALRRRPPSTGLVTVQLATGSDLVQHFTALAVSLVPGSLIIDADPVKRTLTIHVLYSTPQPPERFIEQVLAQESRIRRALGDDSR